MDTRQQRFLNRDGTFNISQDGRAAIRLGDLYHSLLALDRRVFFGVSLLVYLAVNLLFAFAYYCCGPEQFDGMRSGSHSEFFADCFFFSVQTLSTIGYGKISPTGLSAHVLVMMEAISGLMGLAVMTGLFFSRFSRPTSRVVFSRVALVLAQDGVPTLIFRIANERLNQIVEARAHVVLVKKEVTKEGEVYRNLYDLKLERGHSPLFTMSWTIAHPITPDSPLYGMDRAALEVADVEILVSISGTDETFSQPIHARFSYIPSEIIWDHRFVDVLLRDDDGKMRLHLERMDLIDPVSTP